MFGLDSILGAAGGGPTSAKTGELTSTNTFGAVSFGNKQTGGGLNWQLVGIIGVVVLIGLWLWKRR